MENFFNENEEIGTDLALPFLCHPDSLSQGNYLLPGFFGKAPLEPKRIYKKPQITFPCTDFLFD